MKGLVQLQSAHDLLAKLRHDYARLQDAPNDPYVAFDVFVTAEHLLDWVYPGAPGRDRRTAEQDAHPVLQVISHLATGARHMVPDEHGTASQGSSNLIVSLEGAAATELGAAVTPLKLAARALQYWADHPHFQ